jgi:mono/diheme cytochrome c family protein
VHVNHRKPTKAPIARLAAVLASALVWIPHPGARASQDVDPLLAEMGAETFQQYCTACHGLDGRGNGPAAGALKKPPADLTRISERRGGKFPEGEIAKIIDGRFAIQAHGTREMPIWGEHLGLGIPDDQLSEAIVRGKVATLVEYLKSIQQPGVSPASHQR